MKRSPTELAYVTAALENARPADVVIILFDLLVGDLKNAIAAIQAKDVEKRSKDLKHGFLVLQQLQGSLDMENGGAAAVHFSRFYSSVRTQMMEAHVKANPEILQHQIELLRQVREAWQQVGQANTSQAASSPSPLPTPQPARQTTDEDTGASWTA